MGQRPRTATRAVTVGWTAAATGVLLLAAPGPGAAVELVTDTTAGSDPTAPLVAAAALTAWGLAGWLCVTALVTAIASRPGRTGAVAGAVARRIAPAAVRRALEVSLGLTVAVGTLGMSNAAAAAVPAPAPSSDAAQPGAAVRLDWPTEPAPVPPSGATDPDPASTPRGPASLAGPTAAGTSPSATPASPVAPAASAAAVTPQVRSPAQNPGTPADPVVVQRGESLWTISRRELQAAGAPATVRDVAAAWPRWWAANREVIGEDPDLLRPGARLTAPPPD